MNNTLIQLGKDYRLIQQENTEKQILNLIDSGIELISIEDMQNKLSEIGLKLDLNENNYLNLYYNDYNINKFYEATTQPIDKKGVSAYNIRSEFYNLHINSDIIFYTEIGKKLKELREKYFCILTKRKIKYILSF
jgi:hypothetical protein